MAHPAVHYIVILLNLIAYILSALRCTNSWPIDHPTHGFSQLPFNTSHYHIQKPFNLELHQRYSFIHGVHKLWVYSTDKPLSPNSPTKPRSEIIITGYDYTSGVWQFQAHGYVPCGTSGVCLMQVFGSTPPQATTFMLRTYNGSLTYYKTPVIIPNIYNRWFKLNVIHDADAKTVKVYIDGVLKFEAAGRGGGASHYFKCGVYAQNDDTFYMESRWKDIKIFRKQYYY